MSKDNNTLVDSKLALSFFLDSLLMETELPEPQQVVEEAVSEPVVSLVVETEVKLETKLDERPATEIVAPISEVKEIVETADEVATEVTQEAEVQSKSVEQLAEISKEPFQALLFKVAGLSLAVRLIELGGVLEWDESVITEMPGHSPFYMGLLQYQGKSIPVIDTARLVFPKDKLVSLSADKPYERVKRIVLIDDGKWGLACDEIAEVVDLTAESVKWRENRTKRKWMAGTVIEHMCALVDASGFSEMLEDGSHKRK